MMNNLWTGSYTSLYMILTLLAIVLLGSIKKCNKKFLL